MFELMKEVLKNKDKSFLKKKEEFFPVNSIEVACHNVFLKTYDLLKKEEKKKSGW